MSVRHRADVALAVIGSLLVLAALVLIWALRITVPGDIYVSELGATGMRTAAGFMVSLLLIVVGGSLVAYAGRDIRSRVRILKLWSPSVSLWIACGFFLVASQVTCRAGCPLPTGTGWNYDFQDVTHITSATSAFVLACWAMLQVSFAVGHRVLARFSLTMAIAVGVVSGLGGLASLTGIEVGFGSRLELAATTLAIAWVVVFGASLAGSRIRAQRRVISSSSRLASPTST